MSNKNQLTEANGGKKNFFQKVANFAIKVSKGLARSFRDMIAELKKVTWPSKQDLINYTIVVLAFMFVLIVIIGIEDWISAAIVGLITNR